MKKIDFNEKSKISYCIPTALRDEQIKININKVKARFEPSKEFKKEPIAIVAFAPSLNETREELKNFKYIMTCSGAHKFLIDRGIVPNYHVDLEPRGHKIKMLGEPHKDVEYLIASTIHPNYLDQLKGYNVKLWHIFATEEEGARVLPRGEWMVCGGSSVGLRCLTLARLLGFTDLHVFGMDGSFGATGSHTDSHPNAPKEGHETEYNGKKYLTTPSMLFCAKETAKELDQMADVTAKFYGEGLLQDMMKDYIPNKKRGTDIAYNKPKLISDEYVELNKKLHEDNPTYGMGGARHKETVLKIYDHPDINSILDYGAGKRQLAKSLPFPIWEYDPAVPEIAEPPKPADLVVVADVLEHIEPDKLNFVLEDLKRCVKQVGYFVISTRKAVKTYANGQNAHLIIQGKDWWEKKLSKYFTIAKTVEAKDELQIVVAPKVEKQPDITTVEKNGSKYKFYTPNEITKWRAETLFTKEPSTVEWIEQMKEGEVMYDIGANVGSYSILAGAKGVKVYSFEPEAENYSLLVKNLQLNNIEPNAYCLALSDKEKAGTLYAGQRGAGGACHSFGEKVGHDLQERKSAFTQGCFGMPMDKLIADGLPHPQHIKIDVDGFEFKVVMGAEKILQNGVKSLLVEVNTNLPEHVKMVDYLCSMGFEFDEQQVERAKRKEGTFKGVAEYIFTKTKTQKKYSEAYGFECIQDSKMFDNPYPYLYINEFFNHDTYQDILKSLNETEFIEIEKSRGTKGYPLRFTGKTPEFLNNFLMNGAFKEALLSKFGIVDDNYSEDLILVRDLPGYSIPPHTDSVKKVITVLIYLPEDNSMEEEGTSIYRPKKDGFICKDGRHYNFDDFDKVKTMPFRPNSMFAFARTDNSFHGVSPSKCIRNVLLYNINKK